MASALVMPMTAALAEQYAAARCSVTIVRLQRICRSGLTSIWPSYNTELTCNVDYSSFVACSAIVGRKRNLGQHLPEFGPRAQPAAPIVDTNDAIKGLQAHFVGSGSFADDTCGVDSIVDSTKSGNGPLHHLLNAVGIGNVDEHWKDCHIFLRCESFDFVGRVKETFA